MGRNYKDFSGIKNPNYKTGLRCNNSELSGLYYSWQNMKARCIRKSHPKYHRYGGRGISICDQWMTIDGFYKWAKASGWSKGMTLDRIDNDGNYCPENCQWVNLPTNSRKKSTTKITIFQAAEIRKRLSLGEDEYDLAIEYGVQHGTIWFIKNKVTHVEDGMCTKMIKKRKNKKKKENKPMV